MAIYLCKKLREYNSVFIIGALLILFSIFHTPANAGPPLFMLKNGTGNKIIYLLGTIHAAPLGKALSAPILHLLGAQQFDVVMFEHELINIPLQFLNETSLPGISLAEALASKEELKEIIPPILDRLTAQEEIFATPQEKIKFEFNTLLEKPVWLVDLFLSVDLTFKAMQEVQGGMELELASLVNGKIEYLEDVREILEILQKDSEDPQIHLNRIVASLQQLQNFSPKTFIDLVSYNNFISLTGTKHPPSVGERNELWISKINDALESNQLIFIAVGNGHLFGPKGLLNLLIKLGYNNVSMITSMGEEQRLMGEVLMDLMQ
jgi:uncharacterized protein YbaP (TraB family)